MYLLVFLHCNPYSCRLPLHMQVADESFHLMFSQFISYELIHITRRTKIQVQSQRCELLGNGEKRMGYVRDPDTLHTSFLLDLVAKSKLLTH